MKFKKIVSLVLACFMVAGMTCVTAFADAPPTELVTDFDGATYVDPQEDEGEDVEAFADVRSDKAPPSPTAKLEITSSDGTYFDPKYDRAEMDETYSLTVRYENQKPDFDESAVEVTWAIKNASKEGMVTLGTAGGDYSNGYTNTMTIKEYGNFQLYVEIKAGPNSTSRLTYDVRTVADPNAPFFLTYINEYGIEEYPDDRIYPGETVYTGFSINKDLNSYYRDDFISSKLPKSVTCSDSARFDFRLEGVLQKNDKYYGGIVYRAKKDAAGKTEWTVEDIGKEFNTKMTVTFTDGTSVSYDYHAVMTQTPNARLVDHVYDVEAGKTYTNKFDVTDKKDLLSDNTNIIAEWEVRTGANNVMLGASSVSAKAIGTHTPIENTIKFIGRGAVKLHVGFTNEPRLEDREDNLRGGWILEYVVKGDAKPMLPDEIIAAPGSDAEKTVVDVPSTGNLNAAALDKIKKLAEENKTEKVELNLGDATIAIDVKGLDDKAFKDAVAANGGVFDPLITLAAPAKLGTSGINTNGAKWLDFAHSGALPGETTIKLNVSDFFSDADTLVLWYYNSKTGKMEKKEDIAVDFDPESGDCAFTINHCSTWALYPDLPDFDPNGNVKPKPPVSGGGSSPAPVYPVASKGLESLAKVTELKAESLPEGAKLTKTAAGASIAVVPVSLPANGWVDIEDLTKLAKLGANVGLQIKQAGGPDVILPGGFTFVAEPGRVSYPMLFSAVANDKAAMLKAVNDERAETFMLGSGTTLPVTATISVKTRYANGQAVNVYRYNAASGKAELVSAAKVADSKVVFAAKTLGQFIITTAKL